MRLAKQLQKMKVGALVEEEEEEDKEEDKKKEEDDKDVEDAKCNRGHPEIQIGNSASQFSISCVQSYLIRIQFDNSDK